MPYVFNPFTGCLDWRVSNSLTDNSMADTLHRHSELSASDGDPDGALTIGAGGVVTTGNLILTGIGGSSGSEFGLDGNRISGNAASGVALLRYRGTASVPAYSFVNDLNTGIWQPAYDQLEIVAGGKPFIDLVHAAVPYTLVVNESSYDMDVRIEGNNDANLFFVDGSTDMVGVGVAVPLGKGHIDQASTSSAIPVLYLDQADVSEEMIEFNTTIGEGNAIEAIGSKVLTTTHFIKVTLPGALTTYLPVGTIGAPSFQYLKDSDFTADGDFLVGTGAGTFAVESGATARASLGITSLMDDSMADALHRHSELSGASDGTPDQALVVDTSGKVGIGASSLFAQLHIKEGTSGAGGATGGSNIVSESDDNVNYLTFLSPSGNNYQGIIFGDPADLDIGYIIYYHGDNSFLFRTNAATAMTINSAGNVGIPAASPLAKVHIDQASDSAAIPVLYLDQADVSEEMIEFNSTIGTGNAIEAIGAKVLTTTHFIKTTLPGPVTAYMPVGTIATGSPSSNLIDVVSGYLAAISDEETTEISFAFVPSKISLKYSGTTGHDTTNEIGHTTGSAVITVTGTDTIELVSNHIYSCQYPSATGAHSAGYIHNNTTYAIFMQGGYDGSDLASVSAIPTWDTSLKKLTFTFAATNYDTNFCNVEILATAYA